MKSLFEQMGGTYRQEGDYLIPDFVLPDTESYQIGKYGRMRRSYLKEHRKILYNNYVMECIIIIGKNKGKKQTAPSQSYRFILLFNCLEKT